MACYLIIDNHLRREYNDIDMFVWRRYQSKFLRGHEWVERSFMEHDFAVMSFLRWIHSAGCEVVIKDVSRKDIERNPEQADEQLKLMYKTYYNDTFKQMTGRSWLDSDN